MIDIQSSEATSKFELKSVGVTSLKYPAVIKDSVSGRTQQVLTHWRMGVYLPEDQRGTHMSRFIEELHKRNAEPMDLNDHYNFVDSLTKRLQSSEAQVDTSFTWFRPVEAPVSKREAMLDYKVEFKSVVGEKSRKILCVTVPAKALCPCSKAISDRGAHNQRSIIRVELSFPKDAAIPSIDKIIKLVEGCASSAVYPILKREDEKFITETAYDNPVFVEDIARNVGDALYDIPAVDSFFVEAINQESIHGHDCYAQLSFKR